MKLEGLIGNDDNTNEKEDGYKDQIPNFENDILPEKEELQSYNPRPQPRVPRRVSVPTTALISTSAVDNSVLTQVYEENVIENSDETLSCKICGKVFKGEKMWHRKHYMKQHMETHVEGLSYACQLCDKIFRSKHILSNHKFRHHKN